MLLPKRLDVRVRQFLESRGYVLLRGEDSFALERRKHIIEARNIDLFLDVGANTGQYGKSLRQLGYKGRIVSFEPMRSAFESLNQEALNDQLWEVRPHGLGEQNQDVFLNISGNSISSSVLDMLPIHESLAPKSRYVNKEMISVKPLDAIFEVIRGDSRAIWLKIDVQGFEDRVLKGATKSIGFIDCIQIELSLRPLYKGQLNYIAICQMLDGLGFDLIGIEPGFLDPISGALLQADGIFRKRS
jgi:FkbM family methyltransferase